MPLKGNKPVRDTLIIVAALVGGIGGGALLTYWIESRPEEGPKVAEAEVHTTVEEEDAGDEPELEPTPAEEEAIARGEPVDAPVLAPPEVETPQEPVVVAAPPEMTGGKGDPEEHLPDKESVPAEVIENCHEFFHRRFGEASPMLVREGPLRAGFAVEFDGLVNPWSMMTVSRLPEDLLDVVIVESPEERSFQFESDHGEILEAAKHSVTWKAPAEPGIYCLRILEDESENVMCLHVAVMTPWDGESEYLNGYRLGFYQDKPFRDNPRYRKPRGFIEVTEDTEDAWLSPHLQISQFVCKQESEFPKYMLVDTRLLLKLEQLIEELEKAGQEAKHLYISSGFRTPYYNGAIGNKTSYSRHLYGDAADLFVDSNRDGRLDDLDFSGSVDDGDARLIQRAIESVNEEFRYLQGGLGFYSAANYRNPFIHVDTRGYDARWSH